MAGRSGRIGPVIALVGLILPLSAWAGSTQATLTVGVVVPARCAGCAVPVGGSLHFTAYLPASSTLSVTGSVSLLSGSVKDVAIAAGAFSAKRSYFIWLALTHLASK